MFPFVSICITPPSVLSAASAPISPARTQDHRWPYPEPQYTKRSHLIRGGALVKPGCWTGGGGKQFCRPTTPDSWAAHQCPARPAAVLCPQPLRPHPPELPAVRPYGSGACGDPAEPLRPARSFPRPEGGGSSVALPSPILSLSSGRQSYLCSELFTRRWKWDMLG